MWGEKLGGGVFKGTHTQTFLSSPLFLLYFLLPSSSPSYILAVAPLGHLPPCLIEAVYSARTRGPRAGGQWRLSETLNPMAELGSLRGGQPTPFPQTSQPSATLSASTYMSHTHTHTPCFCVSRRHPRTLL